MSIQLTEEQRHELKEAEPLVIDPQTQEAYILVRKEIFDRMKSLLEDDGLDMQQVAVLVDQAMQEDDAEDPALDFYQRKYGKKP